MRLVHMNGRIYDPLIGRFLSVDPVLANPTDLQHYNPYSYVYNRPLTMTDPNGEFGIFGAIGGAILGGGIGAIVAWSQGKSGAEIAAAAAGGAVTGALIGSGAGLIAGAIQAGTMTGGAAIAASAGVGAFGSASGNVVTQVGTNMYEHGDSFTQAVANIDPESVAVSAVVGAAVGTAGGGAMVLSNAVRTSTAAVQSQMSSNLNTISTELTSQGASSATISQVQNQITAGMANAGAATARTVGAVGSSGNGGVTAAAMEVVAGSATAADNALNNAERPVELTRQPDQPVTPPPPVMDEEERRRLNGAP
jgi:hypothetical protein